MKSKLLSLYKQHKEIANYLIVGGLTTVVSLAIKYILLFTILDASNAVQLQIAVIASWVGAVIFAYWANRKYVFESKAKKLAKEFGLFVSSRIATLLMDMFIMWFFVTALGLDSDQWVVVWTIVSQIVVTVANYVLSKFFVFNKTKNKDKKGFTIIEVVLVLAIAGLIFIMVFIGLPALQRAQRNTERKNDVAMIKAAFERWRLHNSVTVTDSYSSRYDKTKGFCTFYQRYLPDLVDPSTGEPYKVALWGSMNVVDCINRKEENRGKYDTEVHGSGGYGEDDNWALMEVGDIQFDDTAICTEDGGFNDDISSYMGKNVHSGTRLFAIRIRLEGGAATCVDGSY